MISIQPKSENMCFAYKIACKYVALTEMYDRELTDLRDPHDPTEAFITQDVKSLSNSHSVWLRNKIVKDYGIHWNDIMKEIRKHNCYSAQDWINEYERLWCGK